MRRFRSMSSTPGGATEMTTSRFPRRVALWCVGGAVGIFLAANVTAILGAYVAGAVTGHVGAVAAGLSSPAPPGWLTVGSSIGMWAGFIGGPIALLASLGDRSPLRSLGLRWKWIDLLGLPIGVAAQFVVGVITVAIFGHRNYSAPLHRWFDGSGATTVRVLALCLVVIVPLAEELLFRGLLGQGLLRLAEVHSSRHVRLRVVGAIVADGVLFAAAHGEPLQFLGLALFGALQMVLVRRSGRLSMAIASHAAFNAVALSAVVWRGHL
jgi:membrane protease YdiL (CAAX protease family)